MKKLVFIIALFSIISCGQQNEKQDNPKFIEDILNDFISAVEDCNYEKLDKLTHPDFIIYENGSVWTTKEFFQALEGFQDVKITYKVDKPSIIVDNNTAHAQFINHGTFVYSDTTIQMNFIESSTFIKENGIWFIKFYHSTHLK